MTADQFRTCPRCRRLLLGSASHDCVPNTGPIWQSCYTCRDYADHRRDVIASPLAAKARREQRDIYEVVDEFMLAAHERHLRGEPLRPGGPTRVLDPVLGRLAALMSPGLFG